MKINHVALYVTDLESARDFFVKYLGGRSSDVYHNPRTHFRSYFLSFADGARLELMTRPEIEASEKQPMRAGYAHVSFSLGSREAVDALTQRLREDGYRVLDGPRTTGDGYYESCVVGVEDNLVELTV